MPNNYFNSLNYTLGNEDALLEMDILAENTHHVFAVAGSGSRIIPLLTKNPHFVTCIDSSVKQLSFAELRIASVKALDHKKFLTFWGYPFGHMSSDERRATFNSLIISDRARKITSILFKNNNWESLLYAGRWEQTFQRISRLNRMIVGARGLGVFNCKTKEEQENYLKTKFPKNRWSFSVFLLGNAAIFNALLYKGNFPKKNIPKSMHSFYLERFDFLFKQDLARKNYFLQLLLLGKLQFPEGLPRECDRELFLKAKKGIENSQVKYILGDVVEEAKSASLPIDFLSLSDAPSYFNPPREQKFLQNIKNSISAKGVVINRYYLRIPENLNTDGYKNITDDYKKTIAEEKIQMYYFGIYQKI
jgi:S-adenosylmethionine-diacylglycerol 3-amino-3-carboxypropyl transferase